MLTQKKKVPTVASRSINKTIERESRYVEWPNIENLTDLLLFALSNFVYEYPKCESLFP